MIWFADVYGELSPAQIAPKITRRDLRPKGLG